MLHFTYFFSTNISTEYFNPLNAELNPIYHLLALLGAHHILHISRMRVKHAAHSPFFSSKCRLFHNATFFGSCIIHILHTEWVVNATPRPLYSPGKTRYPLDRRLGWPQGRSVRVRKISPPPGFDRRNVQPVASRYTD